MLPVPFPGRAMPTRRDFIHWSTAALGGALLAPEEALAGQAVPAATGSHVGSLFPFIQSQAPREFALSFLRDEFKDPAAWKQRARGKLLELLHYAPPKCEPKPEVVEKTDRDDHVRERVVFNTTPDIRVPAY